MTEQSEQMIFLLQARVPRPRRQLHADLKGMGFKSIDDFYVLDREEQHPNWQSDEIVSIDPRADGSDVYETEDDIVEGKGTVWDQLRCEYLVATLPTTCIPRLRSVVEELVRRYGLDIVIEGRCVGFDDFDAALQKSANAVVDRFGDVPGSKEVAIALDESYQQAQRR